MLVIGSRESSNTAKLLSISKQNLPDSFLIENASDITKEIMEKAKKTQVIGITAGASTPGVIIQEVKTKMSEIYESENFAELLEGSLKTLNTGDIVTGKITSISNTEVNIDLSANVTGILPYEEIANADPAYQVGDSIEAYVVRVSDIEGVAGLSRKRIERIDDWKKIVAAKEEGTVLEGKITKIIKGGCMIALGAVEAFIPASQTGIPKGEDLLPLKGTTQRVLIIEIEDGRSRATASIRAVLRAERKAAAAKVWSELEVGKKYVGTVKSLTSYGAFVDLGGVDGMVHITELSWSRIKSPAEVVQVGDTLEVYVKSFDPEKKRISLGCKTEETNPWNIFTHSFHEGDVATVKIVGITPFGAFAEIIPDVDGLIHISQITDHKIGTPAEVVHLDDVVQVKIIGIDTEKKKVSLSMRALLEEPAEEEAAEEV
jgi:4-hydroxy-3-methylbut-2-enyl diphosphate reductase